MRNSSALRHPNPVHVAAALGLFLLSVYLLTMGGHTYAPDDESFFYVTDSMVRRGEFDIPSNLTHPTVSGQVGVDGKTFTGSGIAQSLVAIPFYLGGLGLSARFDSAFEGYLLRLAVNVLNPLVSALLGVTLFAFGLSFGYSTRVSVALVLIWAFATFSWIEAKTFYNEPLLGLFVLLAFYFLRRAHLDPSAKWFAAAGAFWGLAGITKLQALPSLPAFLLYAAVLIWMQMNKGGAGHRDWRIGFKYTLALGLPALVIIGLGMFYYNYIRFQDPFELGYGDGPANFPMLIGLYGMLASPGHGILFYAPPILLGLAGLPLFARRYGLEALVFGVYFVTVLLFHSRLINWPSGGTWGIRHFYPLLPFLILPAGVLFERARSWLARGAMAAVVLFGVLVQLVAVPLNFDTYIAINPSSPSRDFDAARSPIVAHARLLPERFALWWDQWTMPRAGVLLGAGWLPADAPPGELFPRYLASAARLAIVADPELPVRVRVQAIDYRPADKPTRELQFRLNGQPLVTGRMQNSGGGDAVYAFEIPPPHARTLWLELETPATEKIGGSPMGDELGLQVTDVSASMDDSPLDFYPDLSIPPNPLAIPKASWSWFYNPQNLHWDFWWWYLYYSGLPPAQVWNFAAPLVLLLIVTAVGSGVWLFKQFY